MKEFKSYVLNSKELKPVPFGKIVLDDDKQVNSQDIMSSFEIALKNRYGIHMFYNMSSPTMRYAWNYSKDSESAKKQIFDPNDKELENSLMAGLALYDMNSFSESFITYLKKKAETTDVTDKSNLSEQINVCLELIKKIQKEPNPTRSMGLDSSCKYYMRANENIDTLFMGLFEGKVTNSENYPAERLGRLIDRLETFNKFKFNSDLKAKISGFKNIEKQANFDPASYAKMLKEFHLSIISQYWSPAELNNVRRYLKFVRKFLQLNESMNAASSSIVLREESAKD